MAYEGYQFLKIRVDRGVAFVTIDNPPINLLTLELGAELLREIDSCSTRKDTYYPLLKMCPPYRKKGKIT
jgi:hypothetical protein